MRRIAFTFFSVGLLLYTACTTKSDDCAVTKTCTGASGSGGNGASGGNGGTGGTGTPPGCVPADASGPIEDSCGVFVSSSKGATEAAGTKDAPLSTIAEALMVADGRPIYLCGEVFAEAVVMEAGIDIFGGLDCDSDWAYDATQKAQINGPENEIAWKVTGAGTTTIADVAITAATATDPMGSSLGSSIALLVATSTVDLVRVDLTAGDGAEGKAGDSPNVAGLDGDPGDNGNWVAMAMSCSDAAAEYEGGLGGTKTCGTVNVDGGKGGNGTLADNGDPGLDGNPLGPMGQGGQGRADGGASCDTGGQGAPGDDGGAGTGATGVGSLGPSGYTAPLATVGDDGTPGQGGGGGGGAPECQNNSSLSGPSGAGGGSGGCGGPGGGAGGGGGSSFALVSVAAAVTLDDCHLASGDGGNGGRGGNGQLGGDGGPNGVRGGSPSTAACDGGVGGQGGRGGGGGGGLGGHSAAVAYTAEAPTVDAESVLVEGDFGDGGDGGTGGAGEDGTEGAEGLAATTLPFE